LVAVIVRNGPSSSPPTGSRASSADHIWIKILQPPFVVLLLLFQKDVDADSHQVHISIFESNFSGYKSKLFSTSVDKFHKKNGEKMSPLFDSFGLVPFFSVPLFGFCYCWTSITRSAKFLQTTQKQFRSAQTNCANRIT